MPTPNLSSTRLVPDSDACPCKGEGVYISHGKWEECPFHFADLDAQWLERGADLAEEKKPTPHVRRDELFLWYCAGTLAAWIFLDSFWIVLERTGAM